MRLKKEMSGDNENLDDSQEFLMDEGRKAETRTDFYTPEGVFIRVVYEPGCYYNHPEKWFVLKNQHREGIPLAVALSQLGKDYTNRIKQGKENPQDMISTLIKILHSSGESMRGEVERLKAVAGGYIAYIRDNGYHEVEIKRIEEKDLREHKKAGKPAQTTKTAPDTRLKKLFNQKILFHLKKFLFQFPYSLF